LRKRATIAKWSIIDIPREGPIPPLAALAKHSLHTTHQHLDLQPRRTRSRLTGCLYRCTSARLCTQPALHPQPPPSLRLPYARL